MNMLFSLGIEYTTRVNTDMSPIASQINKPSSVLCGIILYQSTLDIDFKRYFFHTTIISL